MFTKERQGILHRKAGCTGCDGYFIFYFLPTQAYFVSINGMKNDGYREPLPIRDFKRPVNLKRGLQAAYMCAYQLVWITAASTQALHANVDFYGLMASNRL